MKLINLFFVIIFILGCRSKTEFKPLVNPINGITVGQGKSFLVRKMINSNNEIYYMVFYNRNINTDIVALNKSRLKINGQNGSILYMPEYDKSMLSDLEKIK